MAAQELNKPALDDLSKSNLFLASLKNFSLSFYFVVEIFTLVLFQVFGNEAGVPICDTAIKSAMEDVFN